MRAVPPEESDRPALSRGYTRRNRDDLAGGPIWPLLTCIGVFTALVLVGAHCLIFHIIF